ncbi:hypothetical protein GJ699_05850 [Duganella sp. FT80W]|uniref:YfhO family protein n=1 Tax=Duganella guangzhouensis TaxID=2666084 RepID=A0A6I2KVG5_9BURK|nr:hypothetical protein [Duganella guangzhouensis]MRW89502.1 hypothetical protein [Duganella guangzhouensis]
MHIASETPSRHQRAHTWIALAVALLVVGVFFRQQLLNHFAYLSGDRYDGVIQVALLEHWYNFFTGWSHWNSPNYFYPYPKTLGYNEGQFLYGVIYTVFRLCSIESFAANELVNMVIKAIGFFGFLAAARRMLKLPFAWALLGAAVFTLSNNSYMQLSHAQLLSVAFAPVEALLIYETLQALFAQQGKRLFKFGSLAALLFAAWMLTCLYTAWFFTTFTLIVLAVQLVLIGRPGLRQLRDAVIANWRPLLGIAVVGAVALLPFASVYISGGGVSKQRPWSEILYYIPTLFDSFNVGTANLLFGGKMQALHAGCQMCDLGSGEREAGLTPILLVLAGLCVLAIFKRELAVPPAIRTALIGIAAASLIMFLLAIRFGDDSGWIWIYKYMPGGGGLRVVARVFLFLAVPATALAVWYLSRSAWPRLVVLALCALLLAEQINLQPITTLDRRLLIERTSGIPAAPAECKSFFTTASPDTVDGDPSFAVGSLYPHNVDAMLIAELAHLPTINGFASFNPADWNFGAPTSPDYRLRVQAFAQAHKLDGLCELDLVNKRWEAHPVYAATGSRLAYWDLTSATLDGASLQGFADAEPWGRWSVGQEARFKFTLPEHAGRDQLKLKINLITALVNDKHSQRMLVSVNGGPEREFVFKSTARANVELPLPALADGQVELLMRFPDAASPRQLGINADERQLAVGVKSIEIQ